MTEQDKKIKVLLKGNFDEPSPSPDFTKNIMENLVAQEASKEQHEFEYVPVISRLGWMLIGVLFLGVVFLWWGVHGNRAHLTLRTLMRISKRATDLMGRVRCLMLASPVTCEVCAQALVRRTMPAVIAMRTKL